MIAKLRGYFHTLQLLYWERLKKDRRLRELRERFPDGCVFAEGAYVCPDSILADHVRVSEGTSLKNCTVGRGTYFAPNSGFRNCTVGAFCSLGPACSVGMARHPSRDYVSAYPGFYSKHDWAATLRYAQTDFDESPPATIIGNDVWIGAGVIIPGGITVGDGAILATRAVVTKDVAPYSVVGGIPARELRKRFEEDAISFLLELRWWEKDDDWLAKHAKHFRSIGELRNAVQRQTSQ